MPVLPIIIFAIVVIFASVTSKTSQKKAKEASKRQNANVTPEPNYNKEPVVTRSYANRPTAPASKNRFTITQGANKPAYTHVVMPSFQTGHAHVENSLDGLEADCPIAPIATAAKSTDADSPLINLDDAKRALVMAEIISKPKALRTR